jgi:hypothetical protein
MAHVTIFGIKRLRCGTQCYAGKFRMVYQVDRDRESFHLTPGTDNNND